MVMLGHVDSKRGRPAARQEFDHVEKGLAEAERALILVLESDSQIAVTFVN